MEIFNMLKGLQSKVSHPRLADPAPSKAELAECYQAAFRAPDHAWLRPWRFIECRGEEREELGRVLSKSVPKGNDDTASAEATKLAKGPLRAPLVIVCYANMTSHPKVPEIEQIIATGCAINNLSMALYAKGYGSVWRTGNAAYSAEVHQGLKLKSHQKIVGILYVGTPASSDKSIPILDVQDFVVSLANHLE